jgi:hypothetical protein
MSDPMQHYVISRKPAQDKATDAPLKDLLESAQGVEVLGVFSGRAQVKASSGAISSLRARLGSLYRIEPISERTPPERS